VLRYTAEFGGLQQGAIKDVAHGKLWVGCFIARAPAGPARFGEPKWIRIFERSSSSTERFCELKCDNLLPDKQFCLPRVVGTEPDTKSNETSQKRLNQWIGYSPCMNTARAIRTAQ
jgi:hypothetical protein